MKKAASYITLRRVPESYCRIQAVAVYLAVLLGATSFAVQASPTSQSWEVVSLRVDLDDPDHIETTVRDGYIYITIARPVTVRLYSILGQLISQQNIAAGTSRLKVDARGVYILKIGSVTRRITV